VADVMQALIQSLPESQKTYYRNHAVLAQEVVGTFYPPLPVLRKGVEGVTRDRHGWESLHRVGTPRDGTGVPSLASANADPGRGSERRAGTWPATRTRALWPFHQLLTRTS